MKAENIHIEKLPKSEVEIKAEVPTSLIEDYFKKLWEHAAKNAEVPGFRKGTAPENVLKGHINETKILEEAALEAIGEVYPPIILEHELKVISRPHITITKLAKGNPVGFTARVAVLPDVTMPDYKKIAGEYRDKKEVSVTDEELENVLLEVRRGRARQEMMEKSKEDGSTPKMPDDKDLPALDDSFVATIGPFKTVAEFKAKVTEDLKHHKEHQAIDKKRAEMIDALLAETKVEIPDSLIEAELDRMLAQFEGNIASQGLKLQDYLKRIGKTEADMRNEWKEEAEKRAQLQLLLNKIAVAEEIEPDQTRLDEERKKIMEQYKEADPQSVQTYLETVLTNEAVFNFLETGDSKKSLHSH